MSRLFQAIALSNRLLIGALSAGLLISAPVTAAPIIQPGPPGEAGRALSADEAVAITDTSYSADDVYFMQAMIPHHEQALEMSILAETRTNMPELLDIAGKIKASQSDEVAFMQGWLNERDESTEMTMSHDGMDHSAMGHSMSDDGIDHAAMGHHAR